MILESLCRDSFHQWFWVQHSSDLKVDFHLTQNVARMITALLKLNRFLLGSIWEILRQKENVTRATFCTKWKSTLRQGKNLHIWTVGIAIFLRKIETETETRIRKQEIGDRRQRTFSQYCQTTGGIKLFTFNNFIILLYFFKKILYILLILYKIPLKIKGKKFIKIYIYPNYYFYLSLTHTQRS